MNFSCYRMLLVGSLCLATVNATAQSTKAIVPGAVQAHAGKLTGTFRLVESNTGIPSTGTGGACLVANLSRRKCRSDADCRDLRTAYHPEGWAYCLRPRSTLGTKACWIRPGRQADYCRVSPLSPYPLDEHLELPKVDGDPRRNGRPLRWLVQACLNRFDPASGKDHPGCKLSDPAKMKTWSGRATTVHP